MEAATGNERWPIVVKLSEGFRNVAHGFCDQTEAQRLATE